MQRSFWKYEACLAVAGLAACAISHAIFYFFVNPEFDTFQWIWLAAIEAALLVAGLPAWAIGRNLSWVKLAILTNAFNTMLLMLTPAAFVFVDGNWEAGVFVAGYFAIAWAISGILPIAATCAFVDSKTGE